MPVLEIKKYPDPVLKKKSEEVKEVDRETKKIISDMILTMYAKRGIGLAAPQVGISKRIIVIDATRKEDLRQNPLVFINPEIKSGQGSLVIEEGCLSFPGVYIKVKRPARIVVEALDKNGAPVKISAAGLTARVLLHEIDHLNGILFIERISLISKLKLKLKGLKSVSRPK